MASSFFDFSRILRYVVCGLTLTTITAPAVAQSYTYSVLHNFGDGSVANDGAEAQANLTLGTDGNFYGTTPFGGSANLGTVFKMTPAGVVSILHSFGDGSVQNDGYNPISPVIEGDDNKLLRYSLQCSISNDAQRVSDDFA